MHTVRRKAKYAAWYDEPGDPDFPVKNFLFRKYRTPSQPLRADLINSAERGALTNVRTDDYDERQSIERRNKFTPTSPPHANTSPVQPSRDQLESIPASHEARQGKAPYRDIALQPEKDDHVSGSSETAAEDFARKDGSDVANGLKQRPTGEKDHTESLAGSHGDHDDNNGKNKLPKKHFTPMSQVRATIFNSWINVLLICSPIGIALYYAHVTPIAVFVVNFIAIIPLAAMLSYATEEIALRTGEVIGGLLNASFGNAVELIVSIIALTQNQVLIVQTSLIGSMLSNLLLVMGMCFFFGGINRIKQAFNMTVAQTASSLLFLAISALIIPTAFDIFSSTGGKGVAELSRGTSIMLLIVYACYLFFQLKSHTEMYNAPSEKNETRDLNIGGRAQKVKDRLTMRRGSRATLNMTGTQSPEPKAEEDKEQQAEEPQLSLLTAILTLAGSTVLVALNAEYLVDSINAITCEGGISKNFVGLILLPIVGNAAEHATAVTVAVKDKMDLAIGVAVGSSMQIALLVLPFVVVLGWILNNAGMTLYFDGFQVAVLFVAILLVNYLIQDGESHWLEGVLLMTLYIIIAVAAWFYPAASDDCPKKP